MFKWTRLTEETFPKCPLSSVVYWDAVNKNYRLATGDYEEIKDMLKGCTHYCVVMEPPEDYESGIHTTASS